jgi:signal transduction histidine kinase
MVVSLQALRRLLAHGVPPGRGDEDAVRRQWWAALATIQEDLLPADSAAAGIWLAAPLPALHEPALLTRLQGWVWAPAAIDRLLQPGAPLLPAAAALGGGGLAAGFQRLPLGEQDGTDPVLVLITPSLQVALALEGPPRARRLLVRFDADVLTAALDLLDRRLQQDDAGAAARLRRALRDLGPLSNDPELGQRFWPLVAQRLSAMAPSVTLQPLVEGGHRGSSAAMVGSELALLEALTHEVRTPLATIRTLIRSLLRRRELPPLVRERLQQIDVECSEQIDRFGLIFLAAELQREPGGGQPLAKSDLARTDLSELLSRLEEVWRRQLQRRGLQLRLVLAPDLPPVLSDPSRLETILGGLVDRFSRSLPSGTEVCLSLRPAGSRLKLRISSAGAGGAGRGTTAPAALGAEERGDPDSEPVGPVLSWNPDTGSLQLSRQATQRLFHRLGGRLTERGGSSLTVYFPLC